MDGYSLSGCYRQSAGGSRKRDLQEACIQLLLTGFAIENAQADVDSQIIA